MRSSCVAASTPGHRLIEEVELGLRGERAGEEDPPALAAGKRADLSPSEVGHVHLRQGGGDRRMVARARSPDRAQPGVPTHHHDVAGTDREAPVHGFRLGHIGHRSRMRTRRRPEHLHLPGPWAEQPCDELEERALAATVRADDRGQRARLQDEVHLLQDGSILVSNGHIRETDAGRHWDHRRGRRRRRHRRAPTSCSTSQRIRAS